MESGPAARNNDWIVAATVDGNPLPEKYFPLRLVGESLDKGQMVGAITTIQLDLTAVAAAVSPTPADESGASVNLPVVSANIADLTFTGLFNSETALDEAGLRTLEVVKITATHPKKGPMDYEGVKLNTLLDMIGIKEGATTLVFTAGDGFSAELPLADVRSCPDCMVSFTDTPGELFMVMPELSSGTWVKDIVTIEAK